MTKLKKDFKGMAVKIDLINLLAFPIKDYSNPETLLEYTKLGRAGKIMNISTANVYLVIDVLALEDKNYYICLIDDMNVAILSSKLGIPI